MEDISEMSCCQSVASSALKVVSKPSMATKASSAVLDSRLLQSGAGSTSLSAILTPRHRAYAACHVIQFHFCMSKTDIRSLKITAYCNIPIVCGIFFFKCIASPFRIHELTHFFVQGPLSCHGHRAYCSQLSCCSWKMPAIPHQYNDFLQHCMHSQLKDISIVLWYI